MSARLRIAGLALAIAALIVIAASCADFEAPDDPAFGLPDVAVATPSLSRDVQPIFTKRCSIGGCHSLATHQFGLVLTPDSAYANLVGRAASLRPQLQRVVPFKPDSSWLMAMIVADTTQRRSIPRMPLAAHPLTPNQIATIANWIARGAPRD